MFAPGGEAVAGARRGGVSLRQQRECGFGWERKTAALRAPCSSGPRAGGPRAAPPPAPRSPPPPSPPAASARRGPASPAQCAWGKSSRGGVPRSSQHAPTCRRTAQARHREDMRGERCVTQAAASRAESGASASASRATWTRSSRACPRSPTARRSCPRPGPSSAPPATRPPTSEWKAHSPAAAGGGASARVVSRRAGVVCEVRERRSHSGGGRRGARVPG